MVDYSGSKVWQKCSRSYALAQLDYPEGIGIKPSLHIKRDYIGDTDLRHVSPEKFKSLLNKFRHYYIQMRKSRGD
tara:strand:+ start:590 stop:814 length:225 start_codon:yes stop_codon:yes gene_type:complete